MERYLEARATLVRYAPFFATLLLWAPEEWTHNIPTAATDGRKLLLNPDFIEGLTRKEIAGLLCHEVLHMALRHVKRRGSRNPKLWNIACDVSINGMIVEEAKGGYIALPQGGIEMPKLAHLSPEEIYELLLQEGAAPELGLADLLEGEGEGENTPGPTPNWEGAIKEAIQRAGVGSPMAQRMAKQVETPTDWRVVLREFLQPKGGDFNGYDRRFISAELYLEALEDHFDPDGVKAHIVVDTSGSINDELLGMFLGEIAAIADTFPQLEVLVWSADSELYGPSTIEKFSPVGGGGTDFRPIFQKVEPDDLVIYLTDGYGLMPEKPHHKTVWAITPGGVEAFPFGKVARLVR